MTRHSIVARDAEMGGRPIYESRDISVGDYNTLGITGRSGRANAKWVEMKAGDLERKSAPPDSGGSATGSRAPELADANRLPQRMAQFDTNGDGKLQRSEAPERMQQFFDRIDTDGDGAIDGPEASAMRTRRARRERDARTKP